MKPDPDYNEYFRQWSSIYESKNYEHGLSGYFLTKSHEWSEKCFAEEDKFSQVLEVGSGTGIHIRAVRHKFDQYIISDLNTSFLEQVQLGHSVNGEVLVRAEDATALSFADNTFDRVIAAHILEHLPKPHEALREWQRILKPGGVLSLVLPCDPGIAWRMGRYLFTRKKFIDSGMEYDYWMAREHINPINNLVTFVRYYFDDFKEHWYPFRIPSMDLNLFYVVHIYV